jgi:16S rRNA (adenine1518-N6/adenine1519-N6)-dimethyltransferase
VSQTSGALLGPAEIRELATRLGIRPTKTLGQNFVIDGGTVRKIVRQAGVTPGERVVEVGPGLGSLTLGLLEAGASVVAVEIDPVLARLLPETVAAHLPDVYPPTGDPRLQVVGADALDVTELPGPPPTALVANLPYNVSVPVLLTFLQRFDSIQRVLVMVQAEVADRLAAPPGSRTYGVPSAKVAWYASARRTSTIARTVFWPVPNVDSALVALERRDPPSTTASREEVFAVVDAAFAQRRKMLRSALAGLAGSAVAVEDFARVAQALATARAA